MTSTYRGLYHEWERGQWEAGAVDVSVDRATWRGVGPQERTAVLRVLGDAQVAAVRSGEALVALIDAAPAEEQQVFLTTELVDASRHAVFYDHWLVEVTGVAGDMESRVDQNAAASTAEIRTIVDAVSQSANRLREATGVRDVLAAALRSLQSLVAVTGGRSSRTALQEVLTFHSMPGLEEGLAAVERDQERHARFAELLSADLATVAPAVRP